MQYPIAASFLPSVELTCCVGRVSKRRHYVIALASFPASFGVTLQCQTIDNRITDYVAESHDNNVTTTDVTSIRPQYRVSDKPFPHLLVNILRGSRSTRHPYWHDFISYNFDHCSYGQVVNEDENRTHAVYPFRKLHHIELCKPTRL